MALVELIMPKMGESITEATILGWLKKPGDRIEQDEAVLEVATDKVDTEVPSTHAGVPREILAKEGEVVKVGKAIAIITTDVGVEVSVTAPSASQQKVTATEPVLQAAPSNNGSNGSHVSDFKSSN